MQHPDFIIIGAEKAGTTWLHDRLEEHPEVFLPPVKELHYFNRFDSNLNEIDNFTKKGPDWYARFFENAPGYQKTGEATPMYLCDPDAPDRIKATIPEASIIISLRNPITRAYSHYRMARAKAHLSADLDHVLTVEDARILQRGRYAQQIARWQDIWPSERLKVIFFEDLVGQQSAETLQEVCSFLGIDPSPFARHEASAGNKNAATEYRSAGFYNASVKAARALRNFGPTRGLADRLKASGLYDTIKRANRKAADYAPLPDAARAHLRAYYAEDVTQLEALLGRKVPWSDFEPVAA